MSYPKPSIAVDLALVTVTGRELRCLLTRRTDADAVRGEWALPGGYVHIDEAIEDTAIRVLQDKVGMKNVYLEQLYTYGDPKRDPRERVISITHLALIPAANLNSTTITNDDLILARLEVSWDGEEGGVARALSDEFGELTLAFDHAFILGDLVKRLRGKLDYTAVALELLPRFFTLRQAQEVYEAILGRNLTKPAFRRKLLDRKIIKPTGKRETASAFRPAELYTKL